MFLHPLPDLLLSPLRPPPRLRLPILLLPRWRIRSAPFLPRHFVREALHALCGRLRPQAAAAHG